ncbi:IniB N-terminal domain-containing protein [Actinophytocola xanthii]|uniref:Uncharacterized protein n=1 Tax=Actinophytocola xanthii TaxID=1912961 RepID=A0A1Q8CT00_9PSEU|nr:IniB N-terminal domain-containing protein [Actinophytocola xanthii]OLF17492.1 hypothetical protein BU204_11165 [Actinophytocola xanthii]
MYSFQTLQDFVLNLLDDEAARTAYLADPVGALCDAGLGDLTPQDVEEVIPLVTDALPAETPLGELDLDIDHITDGMGHVTGVTAKTELGDLGYVGGLVNHDADGTDLWAGGQTVAGRVAGIVQTEDGFVSGGLSTPIVYAGANSHGDYLVTTADPGDVLDGIADHVDGLDGKIDDAAGTATHLIGTGAGKLTGAVDHGADSLAGFLAGTPAAPVSDLVTDSAEHVNEAIVSGAGSVTEHLEELPSLDELPVEVPEVGDHLPELPELPDLEGNLHDLPELDLEDLDLPAELPDLPVELPELSELPVDTSVVTDIVSHSPVGGVVDHVSDATGKLPVVGDLTDDLDLGL